MPTLDTLAQLTADEWFFIIVFFAMCIAACVVVFHECGSRRHRDSWMFED